MFVPLLCLLCVALSLGIKPKPPSVLQPNGHIIMEEVKPRAISGRRMTSGHNKGGPPEAKKVFRVPSNALEEIEVKFPEKDYASAKRGHKTDCGFRGAACRLNEDCCGENCIGVACW